MTFHFRIGQTLLTSMPLLQKLRLTRFAGPLVAFIMVPAVAACFYWVWPRNSPTQAPRPGGPVAEQTAAGASAAGNDVLPDTIRSKTRASRIQTHVNANRDTWPTEEFSEKAGAALKTWLQSVADGQFDESILADECIVETLRPVNLANSFASETVTVRLVDKDQASKLAPNARDAIADLSSQIAADHHIYSKIVSVSQNGNSFQTDVLVEGGGVTRGGRRQWTAIWDCSWRYENESPRLTRVAVKDYEEVDSRTDAWLKDCTAGVLGESSGYQNQLRYGMDYWVNKLEHRLHVNRLGHHGLAVSDVNDDGLEDLFVCQPGGLPNLLFVHHSDGTASERAGESGLAILDDTTAALFADFDNDGDQDLAILTVSGGFVFANNGQGRFTLCTTMPDCKNAFSLTAADYDSDGLLDLYIGRYWPDASERGALPLPVPYYDAINGGRNVLLRNVGTCQFEDVTESVGLNVDNTRYTMAAAWEDYDNDGDQDLYVANDFGRNCLYRNAGGRFQNVAKGQGVEDTAAGMSVAWSDYDHDGMIDLYVGNMFSSAGNRIAYQRQYESSFDEEARWKLQRLARGNSLFRNQANGPFQDVTLTSGASMGRWAWGSLFLDLNNDSWDDIVIANGHVTTQDSGDL